MYVPLVCTICLISIDRARNFSHDIIIYTALNVGSIFDNPAWKIWLNIGSDSANWKFPPLESFFFQQN